MTIREFEDEAAAALEAVPEHLRGYLDTVQIVTAPLPDAGQRRRMRLRHRHRASLYGLYEGWTVPQRLTGDPSGLAPSVITLFRLPLRHDFPDEADLRREIRHTLWHELAHHFGISDRQLREWGVY